MVEDSGRNIGDFEYTRRFFCRALPTQLDDNDSPTLIIQSYYVHQDNYALRVRLKTKSVRIAMTPDPRTRWLCSKSIATNSGLDQSP